MEVTKEFIINKGNTNSNSQNGEQNSEPVNYEWPPTSSPNPITFASLLKASNYDAKGP